MAEDRVGRILYAVEQTQKDVAELTAIVCGSGDPSKGLVVRIDRIEQSAGLARKIFWVVVGALVTPASLGAFLWYLVAQHKP